MGKTNEHFEAIQKHVDALGSEGHFDGYPDAALLVREGELQLIKAKTLIENEGM